MKKSSAITFLRNKVSYNGDDISELEDFFETINFAIEAITKMNGDNFMEEEYIGENEEEYPVLGESDIEIIKNQLCAIKEDIYSIRKIMEKVMEKIL